MVNIETNLDCRIVHLIDGHHESLDTLRLNQHRVLASLTALLETSFKFAFTRRNDQNGKVGLGSALDH